MNQLKHGISLALALALLTNCGGAAPPGSMVDLATENQLTNSDSAAKTINNDIPAVKWLNFDEQKYSRIPGDIKELESIYQALSPAECNEGLEEVLKLNSQLKEPLHLFSKSSGRLTCYRYDNLVECIIDKTEDSKKDEETYANLNIEEISPEPGKVKIKALGNLSCMKTLAEIEDDATYQCGNVSNQ